MPCICQYFATELGLRVKASSLDVKQNDDEANGITNEGSEVINGEVSATELANCKAEIHRLKNSIMSYKISGENMEFLMKKMVEEQRFLVAEIADLRRINEDMRQQQIADRNNQALERSTLLKELSEIKTLLSERSSVVEKVMKQNEELTSALEDANEKIYTMGMKYLKLRGNRRSLKHSWATIPEPTTSSGDSDELCKCND